MVAPLGSGLTRHWQANARVSSAYLRSIACTMVAKGARQWSVSGIRLAGSTGVCAFWAFAWNQRAGLMPCLCSDTACSGPARQYHVSGFLYRCRCHLQRSRGASVDIRVCPRSWERLLRRSSRSSFGLKKGFMTSASGSNLMSRSAHSLTGACSSLRWGSFRRREALRRTSGR